MDYWGVVCVEKMASCGRLRWYEHVGHKDMSDWVSACRKYNSRGQTVRGEVERRGTSVCGVKVVDMKSLGLVQEDARNRDRWRSLTTARDPSNIA